MFRLSGRVGNERLIIDFLERIRFVVRSPYSARSTAIGTRLVGRRARLVRLCYIGIYIGDRGGTPV
jgi:hypothetical protein